MFQHMAAMVLASAGKIDWAKLITIPFFTGAVGWLINWTGLLMLFNPVKFYGVTVPGLAELTALLPRKLQEIPDWMDGRLGWQGILPARAAKMGSISVDKAIAKLGTPAEFYQQLEPDKIAEHIVRMFEPEIPEIVNDVMKREHGGLWQNVPPRGKQTVYERVQVQLPAIVRGMTDEIGTYIDQLLDPKIMVIDHFDKYPGLVNRIMKDVGRKELRLMVNFGFLFGFLLGIPVAVIDHFANAPWLLPIMGIIVGWVTNLLGMYVIFEPVDPRRYGPIKMHGLFLRRQDEVAEVYARIIANDVVTLEHIGDFLMNGPRGDRTRQMIEDAMGPAIDKAAGPLQAALRVAVGAAEYDTIKASVAADAVDRTLLPFQDPEFSKVQAENMRRLIAMRTKELPSRDFVEMLRAAIKEDEWMLYLHGGMMGLMGGLVHLAIFG
jgi:uncharacterized membrane protein YheB (UPF0754 family)